jgi:hypothetical protein
MAAEVVLPLGRARLAHLRQAHGEKLQHIVRPDPAMVRAFLAEEAVRLGGRGHEVVGWVYDQGEELPLTGFEGYFVGTVRDKTDPAQPGRKVGERRTPADIVRLIAHTGTALLDAVEHDLDTRYMRYRDTVEAEILRWIAARAMDEALLQCLNGVYGALLGTLRTHRNLALVAFRDATYRLLELTAHVEVEATDDTIVVRYQVPRLGITNRFTTAISLDRHLRHGYDVMAAINPYMGNPATRTLLQLSD